MKNHITIFSILLIFHTFQGVAQQKINPPNILWIVSEDNSPFIGAYGDEYATTPHIDKLAGRSVLYKNAFATAPVCAPARSTLITGVYPTAMGTQHMRSTNPIPTQIRFFPHYLREAGYYTSNNAKKDYNTIDQPEAWDESSKTASYKNRKPGQPFFAVFNIEISHESSLHQPVTQLRHDPELAPIPPYHPSTPEMKQDLAHYYDKMEEMDARVGEILQELEDSGLAESTIVVYYGDHGGALGRSKRFMYESGLLVPLIIHFPEMYKHLEPAEAGTSSDRIVTFVDFAPTVLSLAGLPVPEYMQGYAFLGEQSSNPQQYAFAFRGRMGDRTDMVRSVRDKQFRYIRNYMPHKIYGQYIDYLWKAPSMQSWEKAFLEGKLNEVQSRFWKTKPVEELFDVTIDPHNINNLALDPDYKKVLKRMRLENRKWMLQVRDVGFIPEAMILEISKSTTLYEYGRGGEYDLKNIIETAEMASMGQVKSLRKLIRKLDDPDPVVRYWAATGCTILGKQSKAAENKLVKLAEDPEVSVQIAASEALYGLSQSDIALQTLISALRSENTMARLHALNVMETMGKDAAPALSEINRLISANLEDQNYDILAAKRLAKILISY
ncbi:MAG: sulfatase-like hydrolase/transferase [Cyclobacteriaceae bacterium]|nr:sulfatase-like hydrolase/transferase [Cyclobacteriaceae bacterium]